jgi:outer membrane protein assembly factor BamB
VLYRAPRTGGTPEPFLRSDEVVAGNPLAVGRVRAQAWRYDNIVAVAQSADGGPFTYYFRSGAGWSYSLLAGSEEWGRVGEPFRVANYQGNLYVWGVVRGNVLRYTSGQFGEFPEPWVQNPGGKQFESALDLAVDGKIYLLQPDGAVLVFFFNEATGERTFERELPAPAVDPPLTAATRFFVSGESPEAGFVFLVDTANERVIQVDKQTGELIQQIRIRPESGFDLSLLSSVALDEGAARPTLYMVNAGQVLRAAVPDRPEPFRQEGTPAAPTPTTAP